MVSKKYKLLKKYPSLPSTWEEGMIVGVGDRHWGFSPESSKYYHGIIGNDEVENNPEFWEKVKEYEIVRMKNTSGNIYSVKPNENLTYELKYHTIYSIKRLSDGEIFSLGDRISEGKIQSIIYKDANIYLEI